jgi:hypothetical protein
MPTFLPSNWLGTLFQMSVDRRILSSLWDSGLSQQWLSSGMSCCVFLQKQTSIIEEHNQSMGFELYQEQENFLQKKKSPDQLWCPPTHLLGGYQGSFCRIKQLHHDVNSVPPSGAEVKNEWGCISAAPCRPSWCGQGQFYLYSALHEWTCVIVSCKRLWQYT